MLVTCSIEPIRQRRLCSPSKFSINNCQMEHLVIKYCHSASNMFWIFLIHHREYIS